MLGVALPRPCAGGKVREGQSKSAAATAAAVHTAANAVNTAPRPRRSAQRDSPHSANMTLQIASQANSFGPNTSQAKSRKNSAKITLTLSQSKSAASATAHSAPAAAHAAAGCRVHAAAAHSAHSATNASRSANSAATRHASHAAVSLTLIKIPL